MIRPSALTEAAILIVAYKNGYEISDMHERARNAYNRLKRDRRISLENKIEYGLLLCEIIRETGPKTEYPADWARLGRMEGDV